MASIPFIVKAISLPYVGKRIILFYLNKKNVRGLIDKLHHSVKCSIEFITLRIYCAVVNKTSLHQLIKRQL